MTAIFEKLEKITKRQNEHSLQYLSILNRPINTDSICVLNVTTAQELLWNDINKMVTSFKMTIEWLACQIT